MSAFRIDARLTPDKKMPPSVVEVLREIMPLCRDLSIDEQAWVTAACLKYLCMKISGEDQERAS